MNDEPLNQNRDGASEDNRVIPKEYLVPFILVTTLFALWGFANNFTDPMVKVFKDVFAISNFQSAFVQMAFYGGYATMAIPAALFIRKFSYKSGIIMGLLLFAGGAMLSIPAAIGVNFWLFILAIYILTFGLAFLETTANPFILAMGSEKTSTMRLNLAQAFNPIGSLTGAFVAASVVMANVNVADFKADVSGFTNQMTVTAEAETELNVLPFLKATIEERNKDANVEAYVQNYVAEAKTAKAAPGYDAEKDERAADKILDNALVDFREGKIESYQGETFTQMQQHDLGLVSKCYMTLGFVVLGTLLVFIIKAMPDTTKSDEGSDDLDLGATVGRLFTNPRYIFGVIAQMFYVGAQIMVWTFIIQYAEKELGMDNATAANHQIMALVIFLTFRFICTYFLKFISPGKLLATLAFGGILTTLGAIHITGMLGLYSLIATSACMSLMFPTIYGLALEGIGEDAKLGSAGLILAIVGAVWLTGFQGAILDFDSFMGTTATRGSFYLSVGCFVIVAIYGFMCRNPKKSTVA
ncbi:MFS transporter [Mariniblastus sp.]|nr:MFS transporter [Mariniblastus sp.]